MLDKFTEKVKNNEDLTISEASSCLKTILEQDYEDAKIAEFLCALSDKGESTSEIVGFANALLSKSVTVDLPQASIDLCGTGGSGLNRFNISTTSTFILAAGGVPVLKHGNKGSKKPNGSFDLLEELGCLVDLDNEKMIDVFNKTGIAFFFARKFHPAMKKVAGGRKIAARRTIFNLVGPLSNPGRPQYQIIGTTNRETGLKLAEALKEQGRKRALVVIGEPGIDELSISGTSHIIELNNGTLSEYDINPADYNIKPADYNSIPAGDAPENAKIFTELLKNGTPASVLDMTCLNSGAAFYCFGKAQSIEEGYKLSKELITSGKVLDKFNSYIEAIS